MNGLKMNQETHSYGWPPPKLTYNAKKHKLVLYDNGRISWRYKFKGKRPSNIERIFAYTLNNPDRTITMIELSERAGLIPSRQRIMKTRQAMPQAHTLKPADYFCNYRLDDEIKKVFRRGNLPLDTVRQIFDLHYNWIVFKG